MQIRIAGAAFLALAACAPISAKAADIAPVYKAAPVVVAPAYNWSGFYIGGNAGYGWADFDRSGWANRVSFPVSGPALDAYNTRVLKDESFIGGVQAGYNVQSGRWVVGLEADVSWTNLKKSIGPDQIPGVPAGNIAVDSTSALNWLATLRGRAGVAFDRLFVYGTGGAAFADVESSVAFRFIPGPSAGSVSKTVSGWTAGGGLEYALAPNWSLKAEYLFVDLSDVSFNTTNIGAIPNSDNAISQKNRLQLVRAGINYRFDWGR